MKANHPNRITAEQYREMQKPKKKPPIKQPKPTANGVTSAAVLWLNLNGFEAWRNNSIGVYDPVKQCFRKNKNNKLGVPDIIGFRKSDGRFLAIEVKVGKDTLSPHQIEFLQAANKAGVIAGVIHSADDVIEIINQLTKAA